MSLRTINELYWRRSRRTRTLATVGLASFLRPRDAILKWNRIYGPKGFQQYQALIPERDARPGIHALLATIAESGTDSFLAVLGRSGIAPSPGLLSFPQPGNADRLVKPFVETSAR